MANEISLNGLNVVSGGSTYKFTSIESIYSSLGINEERFLELLARDFYTVTLASSPTSSTVTYTDTDGSVNTFQVGQFARVADSSQEGGYKIWQCVNNDGTTASWVSGYDVMADYVTSAISNKVDKVDGKGLSTEDFTTALKTKLEGLSNYDDTALSNSITSLQNQFNALVNADADAAIDTFNEIVAFLAGLENTETLEGILGDISTQISGKMDKVTLAAVATSGSYNDLSDKPTIPTVNNATLTIQKNGTSVGTFTANASSNKSINIETQLAFTDKTASSWVSDSTYADFAYRCDISCSGVTADDYAEVIYNVTEATSGDYAPVCETKADVVSIWSAVNTTITIPTIIISR